MYQGVPQGYTGQSPFSFPPPSQSYVPPTQMLGGSEPAPIYPTTPSRFNNSLDKRAYQFRKEKKRSFKWLFLVLILIIIAVSGGMYFFGQNWFNSASSTSNTPGNSTLLTLSTIPQGQKVFPHVTQCIDAQPIGDGTRPEIAYYADAANTPATGNEPAIRMFFASDMPLSLPGARSMQGSIDVIQNPISQIYTGTLLAAKYPSLEVATDLTGGSLPFTPPKIVYGSWNSTTPNGKNIANGEDPWPSYGNMPQPEQGRLTQFTYTAELVWPVSSLTYNGQPLVKGQSYFFHYVLLDTAGDSAYSCLAFRA